MNEFITINSNQLSVYNAKMQVELIIQKVLGCDRVDLYTKKDLFPNTNQLKLISKYIKSIDSGEPIQYIIKQAPFYGRNFFVNKEVLIPRFDTELIIDILKKDKPVNSILDIGTGSGNIAITIAEEKLANNIIATDISEEKLHIAKYNHNKISPKSNIKFIVDDFFNSQIIDEFDIIVSNPPYIPKNQISNLDPLVKNNEPLDALTDQNDGYNFYRQFASYGFDILKPDGFMLLEVGIDNKLDKLYNIFSNYDIKVFKDLNQIERVIKVF